MKPLFLFVFMALSCGVFAQGPYKSLAECQNDTIRYVLYNFSENKERYIGKRMEFMLNEVDIRMLSKQIIVSDTGPHVRDASLRNKIDGLKFRYLCYCQWKKQPVAYQIAISFERLPNNHSWDEFDDRFLDEEGYIIPWNDEMADFFKDFIVENIYVRKFVYGERQDD